MPNIPINEEMVQSVLNRRRPGQNVVTSTSRQEPDQAEIFSGIFEGKTTGTPIMIMVRNKDAHSQDYSGNAELFRPGHGDITYQSKYGIRDWRGGGRSSGRETIGRVAAGAVAFEVLKREGTDIQAYTIELGGVKAEKRDLSEISRNNFYCPDARLLKKWRFERQKSKRKAIPSEGSWKSSQQGSPRDSVIRYSTNWMRTWPKD
jgi:chorismate synthase